MEPPAKVLDTVPFEQKLDWEVFGFRPKPEGVRMPLFTSCGCDGPVRWLPHVRPEFVKLFLDWKRE